MLTWTQSECWLTTLLNAAVVCFARCSGLFLDPSATQPKGVTSGRYKDTQLHYFLAPKWISVLRPTRIFLASSTTVGSMDVATCFLVGFSTTPTYPGFSPRGYSTTGFYLSGNNDWSVYLELDAVEVAWANDNSRSRQALDFPFCDVSFMICASFSFHVECWSTDFFPI